jgi:hypothetical protein
MTDRELLEAAAKAAGIDYEWHHGCGDALHLTAPNATALYWNPLTDDGDALRIAVKLRIKFRYNEALGQALAWTGFPEAESRANIEECGRDECAATRRAITRAAAAVWESRKGE